MSLLKWIDKILTGMRDSVSYETPEESAENYDYYMHGGRP